jgi:hypothetical protein
LCPGPTYGATPSIFSGESAVIWNQHDIARKSEHLLLFDSAKTSTFLVRKSAYFLNVICFDETAVAALLATLEETDCELGQTHVDLIDAIEMHGTARPWSAVIDHRNSALHQLRTSRS